MTHINKSGLQPWLYMEVNKIIEDFISFCSESNNFNSTKRYYWLLQYFSIAVLEYNEVFKRNLFGIDRPSFFYFQNQLQFITFTNMAKRGKILQLKGKALAYSLETLFNQKEILDIDTKNFYVANFYQECLSCLKTNIK